MPFRCRCGKTFEKADTFALHTSACALFHKRRASDTSALLKNRQQTSSKLPTSVNTATTILPILMQQEQEHRIQQQQQQQKEQQSSSPISQEAMIQGYFLPTGLSLQYALEGAARKRSMSYDESTKFSP